VSAPVASFPFFSHGTNLGQKFFLHKNKKACYNIIDTCSCGLSFLGKLAGLTRRMLVYARENDEKDLVKSLPRYYSKKKR
jgi:hypothetical protein